MQRFYQILFVFSFGLTCWLAMMIFHELGHVAGATITGASVQRVVLHPLSISRTDVMPNPSPGIVVWMGPLVGVLLPLAIMISVPQKFKTLQRLVIFFAGFCLVANGAYIGVGWIDEIGDCKEMLRCGTPAWCMALFGAALILLGLYLWHRLGSISRFLSEPSLVTASLTYASTGLLSVIVICELLFSL